MRLLKLNKMKTKRKNKHGAIKKEVDGIVFDSIHESNEYLILKQDLHCNKITDLQLQVRYTFIYNDIKICTYIADFTYTDVTTGLFIVRDAKAWDKKKKEFRSTPEYKLKKKLMKAFYNIDILET